jgi:hypothetical protein
MDMEEFLQKQNLIVNGNNGSGKPQIPPQNRTDWNGASKDEIWELHKWLRSIGATPDWRWSTGLVGFGATDMNISELEKPISCSEQQRQRRIHRQYRYIAVQHFDFRRYWTIEVSCTCTIALGKMPKSFTLLVTLLQEHVLDSFLCIFVL